MSKGLACALLDGVMFVLALLWVNIIRLRVCNVLWGDGIEMSETKMISGLIL